MKQQHNAPVRSMTEQENMAVLAAEVHPLTQWVGDLQRRLPAQQPQPQKFLTGKEVRIEKIGGNGCHNWSDDIRAVLGSRQSGIAAALKP